MVKFRLSFKYYAEILSTSLDLIYVCAKLTYLLEQKKKKKIPLLLIDII